MPTLNTTRKDQLTVEADTVEDALAEISTHLGADAEIMRAQKVHRGGVGGFFAKEMVQLTARKRRSQVAPQPQPSGGGIAGVLERLAQDADAEDGDFRSVLRREMAAESPDGEADGFLDAVGWQTGEPAVTAVEEDAVEPEPEPEPEADLPDPVAVGPALQEVPPFPEVVPVEIVAVADSVVEAPVVPITLPSEPDYDEAAVMDNEPEAPAADLEPEARPIDEAPDVDGTMDAPPGMGSVDWSTTALLRLGMPGPVIAAVANLDPADDLAWIDSISAAVAPHCGRLSTEDVIVVGPHAERLAEPLGLPLVRAGDMAPYAGSFCAMVEDTADDRAWLEYVQGGRGIHLVIGDEPWQDLLVDEPVAVSWVGETSIADALYLAFTLGATLGYGTVDGFVSSMVRAQPTDVALAVRRIVGRR